MKLFVLLILFFFSLKAFPQSGLFCELEFLPFEQHREYLVKNGERLIKEINQTTDELSLQIGKAKVTRRIDGGVQGADTEFLEGLPQNTKIITTTEDMVFRHYSPDHLKAIEDSKMLIAGNRPYILPESHLKQQFDDLTGVFLTKPEHNPHSLWLGYTNSTPHVDFTLPKGMKVFDLGDGVYLVPGTPRYSAWIESAYVNYTKTNVIPSGMEELFAKITKRGGIKSPLKVPIFIKKKPHDGLVQDLKELAPQIEKGYLLPENFTTGYFSRRIEPYLANPTYVANPDTHTLYRGMFLNLDDLQNILKKGMSQDLVSWTGVGGKGLYYTSNEQEAISYIFHNARSKKGVGVVFKVQKTNDMKLLNDPKFNKTNTIYKSEIDLIPENIDDVYLFGEYGLENLNSIIIKAKNNQIKSNDSWVNVFDSGFSR